MTSRRPAWAKALLSWYDQNKRDLPWRRKTSPYRTWVSEIMLQQTTVAAVAPRFEAFFSSFPDIASLARAPEDAVLRAWAGLGYYSRARNLKKAAEKIAADHAGEFPEEFDAILDLPGIGRYTAGAIHSIAFGKPSPVVDGNVMRVFARIFGVAKDIKDAAAQKEFWALATEAVDADRPGDWNQALMELGATVCLPETPDCGACPVRGSCVAFKKGLQESLPVTPKRREFVDLTWRCLWIEKNGKVVLWKRSDEERFLKEHWGLPEARHLKVKPGPVIRTERHTITHHKITIEVREAAAPSKLPPQAQWVAKSELKDRLVSSLWLKCVR